MPDKDPRGSVEMYEAVNTARVPSHKTTNELPLQASPGRLQDPPPAVPRILCSPSLEPSSPPAQDAQKRGAGWENE